MIRVALNCLAPLAACGVCAALAGCATDPPRDSGVDGRAVAELDANRPPAQGALGAPVRDGDIQAWLDQLDAVDAAGKPDERVFSVALTRLRWASAEVMKAVTGSARLPRGRRGLRAVFELLMTQPPDRVTHRIQYEHLRAALRAYAVSPEIAATGGESADSLEFRLAALEWLDRLDALDDAATVAQLLEDGSRPMRWAAARYFRQHPTRMTSAALDAAVKRLESADAETRADAADLLSAFEQILMAPSDRGVRERVAFDAYAVPETRQRQSAAWRAWLKDAAAKLARLVAAG